MMLWDTVVPFFGKRRKEVNAFNNQAQREGHHIYGTALRGDVTEANNTKY